LRPGDVITAIDEKKTPTIEIFRRVLRRTLAEGGPLITFTVQRAGKTLEVTLPVKD
jgi:S1-C subfamily serine protease